MGLRDAFVQLGIVTPHNCRITKDPKLGEGFFIFFLNFHHGGKCFPVQRGFQLGSGKSAPGFEGKELFFFPLKLSNLLTLAF